MATGAWSPENVKALDIQLLMQSGKGYSFNIQDPVELPEICSILVEARIAVTPMAPSLRFAGTMEITGNDLSINRNRVAGILESIPEYFPKFDFQGYDEGPIWSGLRPCSPDGLPYLGRPHRYSNLTVATGHSMMGISLGPATGLLVSQLVSKGPTSLNISALNIERFH